MPTLPFLALVTLAATSPLFGQTTPPCPDGRSEPMFSEILTSEEVMDTFIVTLQKAIASNDQRTVASMVRYPISAWAGRRETRFRTSSELIASYDLVFTPLLKQTIAAARTPCLFTNSQGAMIHDGEIWIRASPEGELKIVTINRPIAR